MVQIDSISSAEAVKQQSRQLRGHIARPKASASFGHRTGQSAMQQAIAERQKGAA